MVILLQEVPHYSIIYILMGRGESETMACSFGFDLLANQTIGLLYECVQRQSDLTQKTSDRCYRWVPYQIKGLWFLASR